MHTKRFITFWVQFHVYHQYTKPKQKIKDEEVNSNKFAIVKS